MAEPAAKKQKSDSSTSSTNKTAIEDVSEYFSDGLFAPSSAQDYRAAYKQSSPYKHAVIPKLFEENLLLKAREELLKLSFKEKETDIYKITQSGDFSNIHLLPEDERAELPTLLTLRNMLYSAQFRRFLREVTGCGPLSGVKTDMSTNNYGSGCHLLNHDDVIGTRRISFILYLPLPEPAWEPQFGGALELYPLSSPPTNPTTPAPKPSVSIPPSFNQFAFFEVQPGHSFHSVEEVAFHPKLQHKSVSGGVGQRISISGWFHRPVPEEEEYEGAQPELTKSSLEQLYAAALRPLTSYGDSEKAPSYIPEKLDDEEVNELQQLVNPMYLDIKTIELLQSKFLEDSHVLLTDFLKEDIANALHEQIKRRDQVDSVARSKRVEKNNYGTSYKIPSHTTGEDNDWKLVGPPHIQRYVSLTRHDNDDLFARVNRLFASKPFRALLSILTSSIPETHLIESRRFRPGLDYTLARGEKSTSETSRLDVGLNLTDNDDIWQSGAVGGWDVWLNGEEDSDEATYGDSGDGDEDAPLLSLPPHFNRLHIVLRDAGLLHFVKYVSTRAMNSRWDVTGEWVTRFL
ncbi:hypothetical protein E3P86_01525 [Wallemia ichthyophaga]|uniref:Fe2OG dioxygenase domain-containing protein n=1 Tax=Wallemia ichthyophaga TaxID=245174 RepID=A0A4T0J771_WALIC|nr:hypothetical protein E3P86_01525 [Wallemia ichthyophaga]